MCDKRRINPIHVLSKHLCIIYKCNVVDGKCTRCGKKYGVPKMENPPPPPVIIKCRCLNTFELSNGMEICRDCGEII